MLWALPSCSADPSGGPSPTRYDWPDAFAFRVEFISSTQQGGRELLRYAESRRLQFQIRDDESYLAAPDSVTKTSTVPGRPPQLMPPSSADTLVWYLGVGTLGELRNVMAACDPALPECRRILPSVLPLQLRRVIPRLSEWPVPQGSSWVDSLTFDDAQRPGGGRGILVTTYRMGRDTTVRAEPYWTLWWHAVLRTYRPGGEAVLAGARPIEEDGMTLVHKQQLLPSYSAWVGATVVGRDSSGNIATGFRGRAYLAGSAFDAELAEPPRP